jgi:hypothetical protein
MPGSCRTACWGGVPGSGMVSGSCQPGHGGKRVVSFFGCAKTSCLWAGHRPGGVAIYMCTLEVLLFDTFLNSLRGRCTSSDSPVHPKYSLPLGFGVELIAGEVWWTRRIPVPEESE